MNTNGIPSSATLCSEDTSHDFFVGDLAHVVASVNVVHHDREWREVKRNVIAEDSVWADSDPTVCALVDQIGIADIAEIGILDFTVRCVKPMLQGPGHIVSVRDPKNTNAFSI